MLMSRVCMRMYQEARLLQQGPSATLIIQAMCRAGPCALTPPPPPPPPHHTRPFLPLSWELICAWQWNQECLRGSY